MKKYCLLWVGTYLACGVVLAVWFLLRFPEAPPTTTPRLPPLPFRAAGALAAGLIGAVPAIIALASLTGVRELLDKRARLLAAEGRTPVDGAHQPFVGRLRRTGPPLVAPLSRRECLGYRYEAGDHSGGSHSSRVTQVEGYALTPASLETATGRVHLRAYLELEFTADLLDTAVAAERLRAHLATATLFKPSLDLAANYRESQKHLLDDDGSIRFDEGRANAPDHASWFEERVLQEGDEVAIFGVYSAPRNAIVPDPQEEILRRAILHKGSPRSIARTFIGRTVLNAVLAVVFGALTWLWIRAFFGHAPEFFT